MCAALINQMSGIKYQLFRYIRDLTPETQDG